MNSTIPSDARSANAPGRAGRLSWYLSRLGAMSPPELAYRLADAARLLVDRLGIRRFEAPASVNRQAFPGLAEGVARQSPIEEWRGAYEKARNGDFAWFGVAWPKADPPDWRLDPASGIGWPATRFGPDIPYRHDARRGDVKLVWELNRLQYLQPIAALAAVTGESGPADLVRRHVADWLAQNPPFLGVNWASGIELGLRAVSLIIVNALVDLGPDLQKALAKSLAAHGYWLARYPSRYSSANNHAIAEALGLLAIGAALPDHPKAGGWVKRGRTILRRESMRQIYPDGAGAEQAIAYQCFTIEMLALADRLGAETRFRFPAAGAFLRAITDASGNSPRIGDDDESRVFWSPPGPEPYALAMQETVGAAPVAPVAPHLRWAMLDHGGAPNPAPDGMAHFPDGGLTVIRDGPLYLAFDHGPLGYLSIAAHGHADALSIWLHVDGRPVLIDAGTYRYHGAGAARDAFRGTAAHNTLTVAGADQSEIAGPFNWSRKASCRVVAIGGDPWSVTAEHDGYSRRFGCIHRRRVERGARRGSLSLIDTLSGACGPWPVSAGFLVAPDNEVSYDDGLWRIGPKLRLKYNGSLKAELQDAVYAPRMGSIEPALRLAFSGVMGSSDLSRFDFSVAD